MSLKEDLLGAHRRHLLFPVAFSCCAASAYQVVVSELVHFSQPQPSHLSTGDPKAAPWCCAWGCEQGGPSSRARPHPQFPVPPPPTASVCSLTAGLLLSLQPARLGYFLRGAPPSTSHRGWQAGRTEHLFSKICQFGRKRRRVEGEG